MQRRKFIQFAFCATALSLALEIPISFSQTTNEHDILESLTEYAKTIKGINFSPPPLSALKSLEEKLVLRLEREDSKTDLPGKIKKIIADDFSSNKVVELNGWELSEFERDLVLYSLIQKEQHGIEIDVQSTTFESADYVDFLTVKDWGPKSTCVGMPFNQQSDGHSSNWFSIAPHNGPLTLYIGDISIPTSKGSDVLTTRIDGKVFDRIVSTPNELDITVYDSARNIKQKIGVFNVLERSIGAINDQGHKSVYFGIIKDWGPKTLPLEQFTGEAKTPLWIQSQCVPKDAIIQIDEISLITTVDSQLITAVYNDRLPKIAVGPHTIWLYSPGHQERIEVGVLELSAP